MELLSAQSDGSSTARLYYRDVNDNWTVLSSLNCGNDTGKEISIEYNYDTGVFNVNYMGAITSVTQKFKQT